MDGDIQHPNQLLESLLSDQPLQIAAGDGTEIPFDGWADVELQISSENYGHVTIQVPILANTMSTVLF